MRKIKNVIGVILLLVLGNIFFINASAVSPEELGPKGLKELTPEESQKLLKNRIKKVNANRLAHQRLDQERAKKGLPPLPDLDPTKPELESELDSTSGLGATSTSLSGATTSTTATPAQVDNSTLAAFPVIGNQGSQNSCTAWATTYYMMSHEVCLATGCNNKTLGTKVFSPRWTYNMINSGVNNGSYFSDAFSLIQNHGAALMSEFPYNASDYRSWDLIASHWRNAINSRMSAMASFSVNTDTGIANLKQRLANGHVLVIGTYISSWQFNTVRANPNVASNPFVGQSIVTYLNGTAGAHAMAVVGYDDNVWVDMNGNGIVDAAELGAFKIANSWGGSWRNAGYSWAAYDAFRLTSGVAGFAPAGRVQLTQAGSAFTSTYTPYQPKLLARVTVSHLSRNQMSLRFAASSTSVQTPQTYWMPSALANKGGAYAFDGSLSAVEGTFYMDLSNLLTGPVDQPLFYLLFSDNASGNPLTVRSFQLVDPQVDNTLFASAQVPVFADASSGRLIAGNYTPDIQAPTAPTNLTAALTSRKQGKRLTTNASLNWSAATDNVGVAKYVIYRNGIKIAETTALSYSDGTTSAGNTYSYQVSALDAAGNESLKSNMASISR